MLKDQVQVSETFKKQASKSIVSIALFVIVYLFLIVLAVGLTALCVTGGFMLIAVRPGLLTILLGLGLASVGLMVLIFLLKFIFKSHKVDRSHLVRITAKQEPKLFEVLQEIVTEVGTTFPKKVYLSSDVNASVFYDSSFWSMFLPIRKNLQIGLGLVNTVTETELKAILAHEFGHFSQRTMKVGSYVFNVNQVIYNMLYENESFDRMIQTWAEISNYFSIFVLIAVKIVNGIQWVLQKMYTFVNLNYMALSREMEFHADEIAAHVCGGEPLQNSLMRMSLAEHAYTEVFNYYERHFKDNFKSQNIYQEQRALVHFYAKESQLSFVKNLPQVHLSDMNKYNKSKLVIKDQWASHPSLEERVERLQHLGIQYDNALDRDAEVLFVDIEKTQKELTKRIFETVAYQGSVKVLDLNEFKTSFEKEFLESSFDKRYNGYYDDKNPTAFDLDDISKRQEVIEDLFSQDNCNLVYHFIGLSNDLEGIRQISLGGIDIKSFDYDGIKYTKKDCESLIVILSQELEDLKTKIEQIDKNVYSYFRSLEAEDNSSSVLKEKYTRYFEFDKSLEAKEDIYNRLSEAVQFINYTTPFEEIESNFRGIKPLEKILKANIEELLADESLKGILTEEVKTDLEKYISKNWIYFIGEQYRDDHLQILFTAMHQYMYVLSRAFFTLKQDLLTYQIGLEKDKVVNA
ncbi:M48 family metallopeptidase [Sediminitomix flava]|uniref:Zn-dependent protease with chaperone function n=1 Tax=Sediminitomix flava TaxID=379075 RepID=A0A315ZAL7_SEDFL|nr:M48 family metallopeptidase [Sediminitomix flava]PWJ42636.1 Zn-dependent protease with chaperone function [Sediminitomix flava]